MEDSRLRGRTPGSARESNHVVLLTLSFGSQCPPLVVKNLPANAGDTRDEDLIPRSGRSPGGGHSNPLQYSCLENPHGQRSLVGYTPWGSKVSDSLPPMDCNPPGSSVHRNSPGQNTGVGCHFLLQGIFPIQGSNPGLPHCRQILYQLSHKGKPRILEWVAFPFSSKSSKTRSPAL